MAMAGILAPAEVIARVADEWDKHLRAAHPGRIGYFKLDEAVTLNGEFRHWREDKRDEKILQMASVIDRDDVYEIAVGIDLEAWEATLGPWLDIEGNHTLRHPYMQLATYVLSKCVGEAKSRGITKPFEIVYDDHKKHRHVFASAYRDFLRATKEFDSGALAIMPYQPHFRDDRDFVMLQAADMLAGEIRLMPTDDKPEPLKNGLCPKLKARGHFHIIDAAELRMLDVAVRGYLAQQQGESNGDD